ncbi:VCBS repeat-containing protein [Pontiellaceae bacterium B12227]|nr:VCBS repeat-containing protein [Pontiellaceae bacterium B12227]
MTAILSMCTSTLHADSFITLDERSEPQGIFTSQSGLYLQGEPAQTLIPPISSSGYSFGYWTLNGAPAVDALGQALIQPTFTLNSNTTAIAHYFQTSEDANADGIADYLQWRLFGSLTNGPSSDTDGDGFNFSEELDRGSHPVIPDSPSDGGTILRLSSPGTFRDGQLWKHYAIRSDPQGIVSLQQGWATNGTALVTPSISYGASSGYYFGYWEVNGVRQADPGGAALPGLTLALTNDTIAIARFFAAGDGDGDGLDDWYEQYWFGSLFQTLETDPDGDGHSIAEEQARGYSPVVADVPEDGGTLLRLSASRTFRDEAQWKHYTIRSDPQGIVTLQQGWTSNGTAVVTPSISYGASSGYYFGYWEVNGIRQADPGGAALPNVVLPMTNDVVAIARFFPSGDDDSDGLADWYEWHWFGSLFQSLETDPDEDGLSIVEEQERGYSPVVADAPEDGGTMLRLSSPGTFRDEAQWKHYTIRSDPQGIVSLQQGWATNEAALATPSISYGASSGYYFGYWEVNGVRQADPGGSALPGLTLTLTNDTTAIARFFAAGDSDADELQDWYEWYWFGSLFQSLETDPDNDGLSIADEQERGYSPVTHDSLSDGGTMLRLSGVATVSFGYFPSITEGMLNGNMASLFSPNASTAGAFDVSSNSHPALGDWDGDGDLDLFVGFEGGGMQIFENAGSPQTANWIDRTSNFTAMAQTWSSINNPAPALGDWSGDGLADLAVGGDTNVIQLILSDGSWTGTQPQITELYLSASNTIPTFGKINIDNLVDLLVLNDAGTVNVFLNTGNPSSPYSTTPSITNLLSTAVPNARSISFIDTNSDGIPDILISDDNGSIWEFHGNAAPQ